MLKSTYLSILGLIIAHRTHVVGVKNNLISHKFSTSRHVLVLFLQLCVSFFLFQHTSMLFFEIVVVFLTPLMMMKVTIRARERSLCEQFVSLLDALIIRMRAGRSFRDAFLQQMSASDPLLFVLMNDFYSSLIYQRPIDELFSHHGIREYFRELALIDRQNHRCIDRLRALRRKMKVKQDFRQKSRQAMSQVRAQSGILALLYSALLIFLYSSGDLVKFPALVGTSLVLFCLGQCALQLIGKGYKWKI